MTWEAGLTLGVVSLMIVGLVRHPQMADVIFVGALSLLTLAGGYRVRDFIGVGVPMVALWFVITMLVVPRVWF